MGALHSVDGFELAGLISFDAALRDAWKEDGHVAKTVQVVLGSANADDLHWGQGTHLYYGVLWSGVQICPAGGRVGGSGQCGLGDWGTVIDAKTGAFIVGGT